MAQGSHKKWGGFETRECAVCNERIVLSRGHAMHSAGQMKARGDDEAYEIVAPFSLCGAHIGSYGQIVQTLKEAA